MPCCPCVQTCRDLPSQVCDYDIMFEIALLQSQIFYNFLASYTSGHIKHMSCVICVKGSGGYGSGLLILWLIELRYDQAVSVRLLSKAFNPHLLSIKAQNESSTLARCGGSGYIRINPDRSENSVFRFTTLSVYTAVFKHPKTSENDYIPILRTRKDVTPGVYLLSE